MAATFKRLNTVVVDSRLAVIQDAYVDSGFQPGGSFSANLANQLSVVASTGACYRGMPVGLSITSGKIVPASEIGAARAVYGGVLSSDITSYVAGRGTKLAIVRGGRIRSYAATALAIGDPVKADTSAAFSGFAKWIAGTDATDIRLGHAYPIDDGSASNGANVTLAAAQGDQIFVELL